MRKFGIALGSIHRILWLAALLALLGGGIAFVPAATAQGGSSDPQLTVLAQGLNVRSGPGVAYPAVGALVQDQQAVVIGHYAASGWWQVQLPGGGSGWVTGGAAYVSISGNTAAVPEVAASALAAAGTIVPATAGASDSPGYGQAGWDNRLPNIYRRRYLRRSARRNQPAPSDQRP